MFKKFVTIALVSVLAVLAGVKTAHAEEKIALVSLQRALNEVEEGKRMKSKLESDFKTKKKEIDDMKVELENLSKQLDNDRKVLSQDALKAKTQTLQAKYFDLQNKAAEYEKQLKTQELESADRILKSLRDVVADVSSKGGYTLVIENSAQTVLFSKNAQDITPQVISAYNKK